MRCSIYTDGSANNKLSDGAPGGWGVVLLTDKGHRKELSGLIQHPDARPTSPSMELQAAIEGLKAIKQPENFEEITLYTDHENVITWSNARRWKYNVFMMEEFHENISRIRRVTPLYFRHVPAHSGNEHNERAHELAFGEYKEGLSNAGVTEEEFEFRRRLEIDHAKKERLAKAAEEWLANNDRSKWRADSIENVEKFQDPGARFYPYVIYDIKIETRPTVRARGRDAYLLAVRDGTCHVSFKDERKWNSRKRGDNKWEYGRMVLIPQEEVLPI
jgi:ribonuclease HI